MVTTRLYLDTRAVAEGQEAPVKISIQKRGKSALLSTGIKVLPTQWDKATQRVVKHPSKGAFNDYLAKLKFKVDDTLQDVILSGQAVDMNATQLKDLAQDSLLGDKKPSQTFGEFFAAYVADKGSSTRTIYESVLKVVEKYDSSALSRPLRGFNKEWGQGFGKWLESHYSPNTKRSNVAKVKAVFAAALKEHLITDNPLDGVRVQLVETRKRNLSREQLRALWNYTPQNRYEQEALDTFKFSFLTIAMNPIDIAGLKPDDLFNGRIEYKRAKTGKKYSIKVVDEVKPLLARYGTKTALFGVFGKATSYGTDYCNKEAAMNKTLSAISQGLGLPKVTFYWARHTWASLATEAGFPVDIVASALGHSHGVRITMVYIHEDAKKVDDANRCVIDFALYK